MQGSFLAQQFNDQSVIEMYSLREALTLIESDKTLCFLGDFGKDKEWRRGFRCFGDPA